MAEDLNDLKHMTTEDLDELVASAGMPKLKARRFKQALLDLGAKLSK